MAIPITYIKFPKAAAPAALLLVCIEREGCHDSVTVSNLQIIYNNIMITLISVVNFLQIQPEREYVP